MKLKAWIERHPKDLDDADIIELFRFTNYRNRIIHSDYIQFIDDAYYTEQLEEYLNMDVEHWELMTPIEYCDTVEANTCVTPSMIDGMTLVIFLDDKEEE